MNEAPETRNRMGFGPADIAWAALFATLAVFGPERSPTVAALLIALAALQVLEARAPALGSVRGSALFTAGKVLLAYVLIGLTGGVSSSYYLLLLVPVISAATRFGPWGAAWTAAGAGAAYLSFLAFLDWDRQFIPVDQIQELTMRVLFLFVVGFLTQRLAQQNRQAAQRYQAAAEKLATADRDLQLAQAAVQRSERLAALGQLTAGLAHELRNPLGTIRVSAEMLEKKVAGDNAVAREMAGYINAEVNRANSLITRFLDFARPLPLRLIKTRIQDIADQAIAELERRQPPFQITVYKNYSPEVLPADMDPEWMQRVVYNLLLNAAEASPAGGAITVKTRPAGQQVEVSVIDRGAGIDPRHRESIFNPFFTTKSSGAGLGLAIVSKIVGEHGGAIAVDSTPGQGSVFRVLVPIDHRPPRENRN
ncbi:MAG: hypothetical protein K2X35_01880 [Bryobacteraceae bacterium]|nr:hypothetical protein [Bryobacteraceae bacterium]